MQNPAIIVKDTRKNGFLLPKTIARKVRKQSHGIVAYPNNDSEKETSILIQLIVGTESGFKLENSDIDCPRIEYSTWNCYDYSATDYRLS